MAFIGLASGRWGALRPVEQLMQVFSYRNGLLFNERVFVPGVGDVLGDDGTVADAFVEQLLGRQTERFLAYCAGVKGLRA